MTCLDDDRVPPQTTSATAATVSTASSSSVPNIFLPMMLLVLLLCETAEVSAASSFVSFAPRPSTTRFSLLRVRRTVALEASLPRNPRGDCLRRRVSSALQASEVLGEGDPSAASMPPPIRRTRTRTGSGRDGVSPATIEFNNRLNSLSQSYDRTSAQRVEKILLEALDHVLGTGGEDGGTADGPSGHGVRPNVVSFTAACNAWARSTDPAAARKAQALLQRMIDLWRSGAYDDARPNAFTVNAVVTAWTRCRERGACDRAVEAVELGTDLFEEADRPDDLRPVARTYNLAINSVARSRTPGCADRARSLLRRMEDLHDMGFDELEPDALTFGAIINGYANDRTDKEACDKAADLLQHMESLYQLGYKRAKPNTFVYNSCLNAFAKAGGKSNAAKAALFLRLIETRYASGDMDVKPDVISYSTVINAYANSGCDDSGERANKILLKMTDLYLGGDYGVRPNAIAYTATIKAWVNAMKGLEGGGESPVMDGNPGPDDDVEDHEGETLPRRGEITIAESAAHRCFELLETCSLLYLAGDKSCCPTQATFDLVREACSMVNDKEGGERVKRVQKTVLERRGGNNNEGKKRGGRVERKER